LFTRIDFTGFNTPVSTFYRHGPLYTVEAGAYKDLLIFSEPSYDVFRDPRVCRRRTPRHVFELRRPIGMNTVTIWRKIAVWSCALSLICLPALLHGEILFLKDGSEIRGKLLGFENDSLVFAPKFGGRVSIHRNDIVSIVFDETAAKKPVATPVETGGEMSMGDLTVVFKDNKLSSKVAVNNSSKKRESEIIRANWIEQLLIADGDTVYAKVDTTTDKTVYQGHDKFYKNTVELEDISVRLPAGTHQCVLVIRNLGSHTNESDFDEGPLDLMLTFGRVGIYADQGTTLWVGIKKGFLRTGQPKLYQAN
jgi:hypothetical protein